MNLTPARALPVLFVLSVASAAWIGGAQDQQDQDAPLTSQHVTGTVHMISSPLSGNVGVCVGPEGVFVIDSKLRAMGEKIDASIKAIDDGPLRYLLNTHWHFDHTGSNEFFGNGSVPILSHHRARARLAGDEGVEGRKASVTPPAALPGLTFDEGIKLYLNGEQIDVLHFMPAHTDGDSVVYFKTSNVMHMGDLYFNGRFPFIDYDSGGSLTGLMDSVAAIADSLNDEVTIIPGHGPVSDLATLREYQAMLAETSALVREALAAGKSAEEMKAEGLLDAYEADWAWGFIDTDRFIDLLVSGLSAK